MKRFVGLFLVCAPLAAWGDAFTLSEPRPVASPALEPSAFGGSDVASDGRDFLVVYAGGASLVSANGTVTPLSTNVGTKVAWVGANYLGFDRAKITAVSRNGIVLGSASLPDASDSFLIASNGSRVLRATRKKNAVGLENVLATVVDSSGGVVARTIVEDDVHSWSAVGVASDGDRFVVVMQGQEGLAVSVLTSAGELLDARPRAMTTPSLTFRNVHVAGNSEGYLVTLDWPPFSYALTLDRDGHVIKPLHEVPWQVTCLIAIDNDYLAFTSDEFSIVLDRDAHAIDPPRRRGRMGAAAFNGAKVLALGLPTATVFAPREPATLQIPVVEVSRQSPRGAFGAGTWLVAWIESTGVYATRIRDGAPLDGRGILVGPPAPHARVAFSGGLFIVVCDTYLQMIDAEGSLVGNRIALATPPLAIAADDTGHVLVIDFQSARLFDTRTLSIVWSVALRTSPSTHADELHAAYDGSDFVVVDPSLPLQCPRFGDGPSNFIRALRIGPDGRVLDPNAVIVTSARSGAYCAEESTAFAWDESVGSILVGDVFGWSRVTIDRDLKSGGGKTALGTAPFRGGGSVAWDGRNFVFGISTPAIEFAVVSRDGVNGFARPTIEGEALEQIVGSDNGTSLVLTSEWNGSIRHILMRIASDEFALSVTPRHRAVH